MNFKDSSRQSNFRGIDCWERDFGKSTVENFFFGELTAKKQVFWWFNCEKRDLKNSALKNRFSGNQRPKVIFRGIDCQKRSIKVTNWQSQSSQNVNKSQNMKKYFSIFFPIPWPYQKFSKFFFENLPHWKKNIFWYVVEDGLKMIPIHSDQRWRHLKKNFFKVPYPLYKLETKPNSTLFRFKLISLGPGMTSLD